VPGGGIPEDPGPSRAGAKAALHDTPLEHRRLLEEVGTWSAEVQVFMAPGMPPVTSQGREVNRLVGTGWLVSEFTSSKMGQLFEGHGQIGFDVERGVALATWIDSEGAGLRTMKGTYDLKRRERILFYDERDENGELGHFKTVTRMLDADHRIFDVFQLDDGRQETPVMHIDYRLESR